MTGKTQPITQKSTSSKLDHLRQNHTWGHFQRGSRRFFYTRRDAPTVLAASVAARVAVAGRPAKTREYF